MLAENPNFGTTSFTATTDERGRFSMIGLRPGQWKFVAQAPGHSATVFEMPVRSAGASNPPITFTLRKAGIIMGPLGNVPARDLQADLNAADALYDQQKWDEAIAAYRAIGAKAPALSVVNLQVGAAYRAKKDYPSAIAAYNELLKVDPGNEKAKIAIAKTQIEMGDTKAAGGDADRGRSRRERRPRRLLRAGRAAAGRAPARGSRTVVPEGLQCRSVLGQAALSTRPPLARQERQRRRRQVLERSRQRRPGVEGSRPGTGRSRSTEVNWPALSATRQSLCWLRRVRPWPHLAGGGSRAPRRRSAVQ